MICGDLIDVRDRAPLWIPFKKVTGAQTLRVPPMNERK